MEENGEFYSSDVIQFISISGVFMVIRVILGVKKREG